MIHTCWTLLTDSWQRGMSDFDMYILPLLCNQNENYYCWSSMIMSSCFNVFAPKNDKDLCKLLEGSVCMVKERKRQNLCNYFSTNI